MSLINASRYLGKLMNIYVGGYVPVLACGLGGERAEIIN